MSLTRKVITLSNSPGDIRNMHWSYNVTPLSFGSCFVSNRFTFEYNGRLCCSWTFRFLSNQNRMSDYPYSLLIPSLRFPVNFAERFSKLVLYTETVLLSCGIKNEKGNTNQSYDYYNTTIDNPFKLFFECGQHGFVFIPDGCLDYPELNHFGSKDIPTYLPNLTQFEYTE